MPEARAEPSRAEPSRAEPDARPPLLLSLPAVALLLGALGLFSPAPAEAQGGASLSGLSLSAGGNPVTMSHCQFAPDAFEDGSCNAVVGRNVTHVTVTPTWSGNRTVTVSSEGYHSFTEITAPVTVSSGGSAQVALSTNWRNRTRVKIVLTTNEVTKSLYTISIRKTGAISVSLTVTPNPVAEDNGTLAANSEATVGVTLSHALDFDHDVIIPLTAAHGTSEDGDWTFSNAANVIIRRGNQTGTTSIRALQDEDTDNEMLTVALGTLPSGLTAGTPSSVVLTINDAGEIGGQTGGGGTTRIDRCALPSNAVSVAEVKGWRDARPQDAAHVLRWNRVLAALGEDVGAGVSPMTVTESKANESRFMRSRWARVTATLEALARCAQGQSAAPTVSLSATPNPVREGSAVRVTATLSSALSSAVTIPLTVARDTSESGDHGTLAGITIPANGLSATGTITTTDDAADDDDERFTVRLGTLPSSVAAGATTSVTVTITDDDTNQGQSGSTGTLMERCASYLPSNAVSVTEVEGWRDAHSQDAAHVLRWNRVLKALGENVGAGVSPMTAAEAEANESLYIGTRWTRVKATLEALATCRAAGGTNGFTYAQNAPAPVPALPVVAQLLLAALLGGGGYRRYLRRR